MAGAKLQAAQSYTSQPAESFNECKAFMKTTQCQNGEFLKVISEGYNAAGEMSVHGCALEAWVFTTWGKKYYTHTWNL